MFHGASKCAIALQVLIPARLGDLLRSKWRDFQPPQNPMSVYSTRPIDHFYSWYIPSPENSNNRSYKHPQRIVHLSSRAIEVVEWRRKTSHVNDDPVFPELSSMPRLDCNRLMSETVKDIWPSYYLEPGGFRNTLHILLSGLDLYQPKFIDDIVNNRYRLLTSNCFRISPFANTSG